MAVIGIVWKHEPCTAYSVMQEFATSASDFMRSKAGTIYPVVGRLVESGQIAYTKEARGPKGDRDLQITAAGMKTLRSWLIEPVPLEEISHTVDLVRTRMAYLGTLDPSERAAFIDNAIAGLRDHVKRSESRVKHYEAAGDAFGALGVRQIAYEAKGRIKWIEQVRDEILALPIGKKQS